MEWRNWIGNLISSRSSHAPPNSCAAVEPVLADFSKGELPSDTARLVDSHLKMCSLCQVTATWHQMTKRAVAARAPVAAPFDMQARILAAIEQSETLLAPPRPTYRWAASRPAFAGAFAVLVCVGLGYYFLGSHGASTRNVIAKGPAPSDHGVGVAAMPGNPSHDLAPRKVANALPGSDGEAHAFRTTPPAKPRVATAPVLTHAPVVRHSFLTVVRHDTTAESVPVHHVTMARNVPSPVVIAPHPVVRPMVAVAPHNTVKHTLVAIVPHDPVSHDTAPATPAPHVETPADTVRVAFSGGSEGGRPAAYDASAPVRIRYASTASGPEHPYGAVTGNGDGGSGVVSLVHADLDKPRMASVRE